MGLRVLLLVTALMALAKGQVPIINDQPTNQTDIAMGQDATFTVVAAGENLAYQWQYGGVDIMDIPDMYSGTNTLTLTVVTVDDSDEGAYFCFVSNENGTVTTDPAFLSVVVDCGSLDNPDNGMVDTNTTEGSTATYTCNTGYNISSGDSRTCQANGTWSGSEPTCDPVDCNVLPGPTNGMVTVTMTTFGETANYTCNNGYTLTGDMTRTCQANGMWSGSEPTCDLVDCSGLDSPTNGIVTLTISTFGETANYTCNNGYTLTGNMTRTCQANGNWSGTAPTCPPVDCGPLTDPTNGTVNASVTTFMSTATYSCINGYNINGSNTRTCQANETWSGSEPTCDIVTCPALTAPDNGTVSVPSNTFESIATYTCNLGYNLTGDMTRTCGATGMWSGAAPTCQIVTCPGLPAPDNGTVSVPSNTFESIATYTCNLGYNLTGDMTRTCGATGMWSGAAPTCQIVTCPALTAPDNGTVSVPSNTFESIATYTCNLGYNLTGDTTRTCQANTSWSGSEPTCAPVDCGGLTNPTNGTVNAPATTFMSTATYTCNPGYNLTGDMTRTCQANVTWSGSEPTCTPVDCGGLTNPTNGTVNAPVTTFMSTATYTCATGYMLDGDMTMTRTCGATGEWSGTDPTCALICGDLTLTDGVVVYSDPTIPRAVSSTANYSCDTGYDLTGISVRTCALSGWNGSAPTCTPVDCGFLGNSSNGAVDTSSGTTFMLTANYTCNTGYTLTGDMTRICGADAMWMPAIAPTCDLATPSITTQPENILNLVPGNTASFTVVADGEQLVYQWQVNGTNINNTAGRYSGTTTSTLNVYNITDSDSALVFVCVITNTAGSTSSLPAQILILSLPEITPPLMDQVVGVGGSVNISCTAVSDDGNVTVSLTTTASNMAGLTTVAPTTTTLQLVNVMMDRVGNYTCTATNARGPVTSTFRLYVVDVEPIPDQSVPTGNDAIFICMAVGAPSNVAYSWTHEVDGGPVSIQNPENVGRVMGINSNMLTITNVGVKDEDMIRCTVSVGGVDLTYTTATLSVIKPFFNQTLLPEYQLTAGDNLTLVCIGENPVGAVSELFIRWRFDHIYLNESDPRITTMTIGSNQLLSQLQILNIPSSYRGEFACELSNRRPFQSINAVTNSTNVVVFFTPEPSFPADGYRKQAGSNFDIVCTINAIPITTFAGIFEVIDGVEVLVINATQQSDKTDVTVRYPIVDIQVDRHNRVFVCRATNRNGNESVNTTIQVFGVPGQINHSRIVTTPLSLISVLVRFPTPIDNNAIITGYMSMLCQDICANTPSPLTSTNSIEDGDYTTITIGGLLPNSVYILRVAAINEAGNGPTPTMNGDAHTFNSSTSADAAPINLAVSTSLTTQTTLLVTWALPPLAIPTGVNTTGFNVTWIRETATSGATETVVFVAEQSPGYLISGLIADASYDIAVVAIYSTPMLVSDAAMVREATLMLGQMPPALLEGTVGDLIEAVAQPTTPLGDSPTSIRIEWVVPQVEFLRGYVGTITFTPFTSSTRRKRQAATTSVPVDTTDNFIMVDDFPGGSMVMPAINGEVGPPGAAVVSVPVFPAGTIIMAPERAPNAPDGLMVVPSTVDPYRALDISWDLPTQPSGVLLRCTIIEIDPDTSQSIIPLTGPLTSHPLSNRAPDTEYTFQVFCSNTFPGALSGTMTGRTQVGVAHPQLALGPITDSGLFTITITPQPTFGPHSNYQVIVSNKPLRNGRTTAITTGDSTDSILPSSLLPYPGMDGYYVTWFSLSRNDNARALVIGNGNPSNNGGNTYINRLLEPGQYYVFVRLYNDAGMYNDSLVLGPVVIPTPLPVAAVIVPIALLAVILLVVLVALLIFAVWRLRGPPRRRAYIPGDKGMTGEKGRRSNNIELRRTRLFAPMLNVGSPDVFTSAGQPTTLMCEASGTPAPDVAWTKDGEPLDKERFIQLADSSLFVNDTDLQDEGEYVVTAVNSAGQADQLVKVTVLRPVPPEPDEAHPPVKAGDFTEKLALLRANDDEALEDEYADIELDWTFTSYAAKLNINKNKNRYINIIPYDHSRVVLSLQDNTPGSDYINGSYVDGYNHPNEYIATQGPIPSTFPDFWRMVWEKDSPTIVMVTNLKEEDKVKCHQYWPSYGTTTYGNIQVTLKEVENLAEYSIRTFTVTPLAGQSRAQMPVREVRQFHFLVWPDHGVPVYATALLTFRKRVLRYHPAKRGPMVVHCSAGVGRTGTFITIDVCLNQVDGESNLDIFNYVRHMRFRRNYMVQTASQYVFIHDAVLESIMCGDNSIPAPELKTKLQALVEVNAETGKSTFDLQFETLNSTSPSDDEFDCSVAQLPDNAAKNRFKEHLPSNEFRVVLSSEEDQCDYICASVLDGYRHRNNFIVTQAPLNETVGDFWRMVWEQKSAAIIMLTQLKEDAQEMSVKYWPGTTGEAGVFGGYQLELSEDEKNKGDYITRRFKLSPVDNPQESRMVTQFHFTTWSKNTPPEGTHSILDLIDELQRVQRKSGNGPITVHCDNGLGRSGAFCTLYTVLERVKAEQVVDVFQAIKTLRIQRVGLMETLDEYIFVHKAVVEFLESFSDYQNFK